MANLRLHKAIHISQRAEPGCEVSVNFMGDLEVSLILCFVIFHSLLVLLCEGMLNSSVLSHKAEDPELKTAEHGPAQTGSLWVARGRNLVLLNAKA